MKLFCSNYWQNPRVTDVVRYFHYNSHHHYHFHYHCKMHLYCPKILLTILLCNLIPLLNFQLNFVFFYRHIFFSSLIPSFSFFTPSKRTQNPFTTIRHVLHVFFILIFIFRQKQSFTDRYPWKFCKFPRKTSALVRPATLLKRDSNTGVFLWNLGNF